MVQFLDKLSASHVQETCNLERQASMSMSVRVSLAIISTNITTRLLVRRVLKSSIGLPHSVQGFTNHHMPNRYSGCMCNEFRMYQLSTRLGLQGYWASEPSGDDIFIKCFTGVCEGGSPRVLCGPLSSSDCVNSSAVLGSCGTHASDTLCGRCNEGIRRP